ncbi:uncharacterized protein B0I36DRAFT_17434 [Microdochium trichocladiopsis]|uniref:F-box domain-containing protein n=1 Tax=Microdochium trichocladiopsis TaxID=1682393 RepID=A0A9P9C0B9_9PEZI|nr:uncharacterized protein B0I36DRAFT_17434 [Microdochium trichocladiopsis]KAH7040964.1 hypothetical protein B0I36DRAFT_17434 [Microdochium trichocladiopsis]
MMPLLAQLPFELRHLIIARIATDNQHQRHVLPALASVSAEWQTAIEAFTFARIHLIPERLDTFASIVVGSRRARLRVLSLHVPLDPYPSRLNDDKELPDARKHTSATVIKPLERLFDILHDWPQPPPLHRVCLLLSVDSVSDTARDEKWDHTGLTHRARSSPLKLERVPMTLQPNSLIHSIRCTGRHLQPTSLLAIGSRCTVLDTLDVELNHDSSSDRDEKQRAGHLCWQP